MRLPIPALIGKNPTTPTFEKMPEWHIFKHIHVLSGLLAFQCIHCQSVGTVSKKTIQRRGKKQLSILRQIDYWILAVTFAEQVKTIEIKMKMRRNENWILQCRRGSNMPRYDTSLCYSAKMIKYKRLTPTSSVREWLQHAQDMTLLCLELLPPMVELAWDATMRAAHGPLAK